MPAAFTLFTGKDHWELLLRARAVENQCYVVAANQWGLVEGKASYGRSLDRRPLGRRPRRRRRTRTASSPPSSTARQLERIRRSVPALANRQPAAYRWPAEVCEAQPVDAVLFDVDFTLAKPGPLLGPEGYHDAGERLGLDLDPERYAAARAAAVEDLQHHPELEHDEEIWLRFTEDIVRGMGGEGQRAREVARAITDGWLHSANFELYEDVLPVLASSASGACRSGSSRTRAATSPRSSDHFKLAVDAWIWSGRHGKVKPSPTIFIAVLDDARRRGREPRSWWATRLEDDVEGARALGMRAYLVDREGRFPEREDALPTPARAPGAHRASRPMARPRPPRARPSPDAQPLATAGQRRLIWILGLGAFGLAWSITTVAAYLPPLLGEFTDSGTLIGLVLAAEGVFAFFVPLFVGPMSDATQPPLGRRRPFMVLALVPDGRLARAAPVHVELPGDGARALRLLLRLLHLRAALPRALSRPLVPDDYFGRAQGVQHVLRGTALGAALVGGGFLLAVWEPFPFILAAGVTLVSCGAVVVLVHEQDRGARPASSASARSLRRRGASSGARSNVRRFLIANTAWEATFAGMRTFVVLYIIDGLDQPLYVSSTVLAVVAAGYVLAARAAGMFGDRVRRSATSSSALRSSTGSGSSSPGSRRRGTGGTTG